jgi:hypothetical protein
LRILLEFVRTFSIPDRRTNNMDVKPRIYALVRLVALQSVAFLRCSLGVSVSAAAPWREKKKVDIRILLLYPSPIPTQARAVLRTSTAL